MARVFNERINVRFITVQDVEINFLVRNIDPAGNKNKGKLFDNSYAL